MNSLCSMRYASLEKRLSTQIQKMGLALLFNMKFTNSIDFIELCKELKTSFQSANFIKKTVFGLCNNETSKIIFWTLFCEGTPNIDWLKLSKEKDLPVIIVDRFGIYLQWEDVIMNTANLPACVVEKYQTMYDTAMMNLIFKCQ